MDNNHKESEKINVKILKSLTEGEQILARDAKEYQTDYAESSQTDAENNVNLENQQENQQENKSIKIYVNSDPSRLVFLCKGLSALKYSS